MQLGEERVYFSLRITVPSREIRVGTQGEGPEAGTKAVAVEKSCLRASFQDHIQLVFKRQTRPACLRMALFTVG